MIQSCGTYYLEKMMQFRLSEIEKNTRSGLYLKPITPPYSTGKDQASQHRGFWHKWFGSRRLNTSWK
jgi:hypothetical protein